MVTGAKPIVVDLPPFNAIRALCRGLNGLKYSRHAQLLPFVCRTYVVRLGRSPQKQLVSDIMRARVFTRLLSHTLAWKFFVVMSMYDRNCIQIYAKPLESWKTERSSCGQTTNLLRIEFDRRIVDIWQLSRAGSCRRVASAKRQGHVYGNRCEYFNSLELSFLLEIAVWEKKLIGLVVSIVDADDFRDVDPWSF